MFTFIFSLILNLFHIVLVHFEFALQLVHNGFVYDDNHADCLTLRLGISKNDALAAEKYSLLVNLFTLHMVKY